MSKRSRSRVDYSGMDPSLRDFNLQGDYIGNRHKKPERSSRRLVMSDLGGTQHTKKQLRFFETDDCSDDNVNCDDSESESKSTDTEVHNDKENFESRFKPQANEIATQYTQEDDFVDVEDSVSSDTSQVYRSSRSRARRQRPSKTLRQRQRVDYQKQLMPRNLTQVLDKEFPIDKPKSPRKSPKKEKLNDEEQLKEPTSRINCFLNQQEYKSFLPVNIREIVTTEEKRLLQLIPNNEEVTELFESRNCSSKSDSIDFDNVAGLDQQKQSLKEMVILPLLYPKLFQGNFAPPRGVLFHGPPGTGKTMIARALASSCCATGKRPVAFFQRKGADVLNKYVGESERQLRLLFEQAKLWQPSIIFFDEIDGLAPVRNSKQDQIHSSIVSTLLSLMDGLDGRGQVVIIGATNRIDSVDPALRRPGRFDREFYFGLPDKEARMKIIEIQASAWHPPLTFDQLSMLGDATHGYNGADVKSLCTEASLHAIRTQFPSIYTSKHVLDIKFEDLNIGIDDFISVMSKIVPSMKRSGAEYGSPTPAILAILLEKGLTVILRWLDCMLDILNYSNSPHHLQKRELITTADYLKSFGPRFCLYGNPGMGLNYYTSAIIHHLESNHVLVRVLNIQELLSHESSPDSAILSAFQEIKRSKVSALILPNLHCWWDEISHQTRNLLLACLNQIKSSATTILGITLEYDLIDIPQEISDLFPKDHSKSWRIMFRAEPPSDKVRKKFFEQVIGHLQGTAKYVPPTTKLEVAEVVAPKAKPNESDLFTVEEREELYAEYNLHRRRVRQIFSAIVRDLKKQFRIFARPQQNNVRIPLDLNDIENRIQQDYYKTPQELLRDIKVISSSILESTRSPQDLIENAQKFAKESQDHVQALNSDFSWQCWYFYLFQKTKLVHLNPAVGDDVPKDDSDIDDAIKLTTATTSQHKRDMVVMLEDEPEESIVNTRSRSDEPIAALEPLIQPLTDLQFHRLLDSLVKRTSESNLENLEHLASILTIVAIQTGKIDIESLMYELN